eukprot:TRINITY_DN24636_c0_g1_i1.p1 TRINITY_DN24636_c0_g1~~TRINITY_DN24636_c0_g1_i1.p1  ORF type:complete len:510 (+),score=144.22 TRINITY_DN24636_c0_g1_i1:57-1586(+)
MQRGYAPTLAGQLQSWPAGLDLDCDATEDALADVHAATAEEYGAVRDLHRLLNERDDGARRIQRVWRGARDRSIFAERVKAAAAGINRFIAGLEWRLQEYSKKNLPLTLDDLVEMTTHQQRVVLTDMVRVSAAYLEECMQNLPLAKSATASRPKTPTRVAPQPRRRSSLARAGVSSIALLPRRAEMGRVALVIVNTKYADLPLPDASTDAAGVEAVAGALRERWFLTFVVRNTDLVELRDALETFVALLRAGSVGLLYYHGIVAHVGGGSHYLVPSDAPAELTSQSVEWEACSLSTLYDNLSVPKELLPVVVLSHAGPIGGPSEAGVEGTLCMGVAPADVGPPERGYLIAPGPLVAGADRWRGLTALWSVGALGRVQHMIGQHEGHGEAFRGLPEDLQVDGVAEQRRDAKLAPHSSFAASMADAILRSQGPWPETLALALGCFETPSDVHICCDAPAHVPPLYIDNAEAAAKMVVTPDDAAAVAAVVGRCDTTGLAAIRRRAQDALPSR